MIPFLAHFFSPCSHPTGESSFCSGWLPFGSWVARVPCAGITRITPREACSGDWSFAISRRTRLPQLSAHARDNANLRTVNRGPLISKFKRDVRLFQTALSFLRFPSFYYVLESFVSGLRLCRSTSLKAIISLYQRP